eukprot:gene22200-8755_t
MANIRLVNTHPEGDCGYHHKYLEQPKNTLPLPSATTARKDERTIREPDPSFRAP